MAFQLSPGVNVSEIDLTTVVPAVATSDGAIAGVFRWGPIGERVLVDSENLLAARFGKPTNFNAETWFTAGNFLSYSNRLYVSRAANTTGTTFAQVFASTSGNTLLTSSNTTGISNGMIVYQTSNSSAVVGGTVTSVNSTSITLSQAAANTDANVALYFSLSGSVYTAVARVTDDAIVANLSYQIIKNEDDYINKTTSSNTTLNFDPDILYVAKYPGAMGNSLRVSVCDNANAFNSTVATSANMNFTIGSSNVVVDTANSAEATALAGLFSIGDQLLVGDNSTIGQQYMKIVSITTGSNSVSFAFEDPYRLHTDVSTNNINKYWEFFNTTETAPGQSDYVLNYGNTSAQDEVHIVVVDDGGSFTGTPGTVLEVYKGLSRAIDAKNNDGSINYYKDVINQNSNYIWWANDRTTAVSNTALNLVSATGSAGNFKLTFGADGYDETNSSAFSVVASAYDMFASPENIDISLVLQGRPIGGSTVAVDGSNKTVVNFQLANYIIDNICETRKDCVALISPDKATTLNNFGNEALTLKAWASVIRSSSYAVIDSGYKYQYDRYNDLYRWIPMNGDIAGLCARTDQTNDAWWSPAGFNRGQIKNLVRLAYNPRKAERDLLYSNRINPVVTFPGQGTILFGDKTAQAKPSAFDRINVRRLFIVLEKAISVAAKYSLFEFNDAFTRAQFKNLITPYLRNIQGRRGITDFLVVCDDTNNTAQVIDSNQFVGDIYIKPARSINFIQLNFVAVGTGVQFSEVVGKFG